MVGEETTTFEKLKKGLFELLRGYPNYRFFGKIEYYLQSSQSSLNVLEKDGIIEFASQKEAKELNEKLTPEQRAQLKADGKKGPIWYRLASNGIDLAVSLMNADYSKKITEYNEKISNYQREVLRYTRETQKLNRRTQILTIIMVIFTIGVFCIGLFHLVLAYLQNPIPLF